VQHFGVSMMWGVRAGASLGVHCAVLGGGALGGKSRTSSALSVARTLLCLRVEIVSTLLPRLDHGYVGISTSPGLTGLFSR